MDDRSNKICKTLLIYTGITAFCALFSAVYEHFSHGVYSLYMVFLFLIPFAGGILPTCAFLFLRPIPCPGPFARNVYNWGIATLSVGCCLRGVLEIYGTDSAYIPYYMYSGLALIAASIIIYAISSTSKQNA